MDRQASQRPTVGGAGSSRSRAAGGDEAVGGAVVERTAVVRVTRRLHFSSAHRLGRRDWSESRNAEVFGQCASPNWHGHNYELDVTVEGRVDPETGFVMDLKALREVVERRVVGQVDHRNLNLDVPWLEGVNPTTENLVVGIWRQLAATLPAGVRLARLVLWETPRNYVEYTGEMETDRG